MLAYAFQLLKSDGYAERDAESFENTADILSAILSQGISVLIKRGLGRGYSSVTEELCGVRGKIGIADSIGSGSIHKKRLICTYDEFTVDTYLNRVIKVTVELLLKADIPAHRKKELRKLLLYFEGVGDIDYRRIDWNIRYNKNDRYYRMLISVCYLALEGLIQTTSEGEIKVMKFLDEQRTYRLYEKFILEYYRKEHSDKVKASASRIDWALDDGICDMLPAMQSDITLTCGSRTLIIDAKYYEHNMQTRYEKRTLHSANLYQIFTYVKNRAVSGEEVSGMLLYAKTDEEFQPDGIYMMSGNSISVKTLDLGVSFAEIKGQLDGIVNNFVGG